MPLPHEIPLPPGNLFISGLFPRKRCRRFQEHARGEIIWISRKCCPGKHSPVTRINRWPHHRRRMSPRRRLIPSSRKHRQRHFPRSIAFPLNRSIKIHYRQTGPERRRAPSTALSIAMKEKLSNKTWEKNLRRNHQTAPTLYAALSSFIFARRKYDEDRSEKGRSSSSIDAQWTIDYTWQGGRVTKRYSKRKRWKSKA